MRSIEERGGVAGHKGIEARRKDSGRRGQEERERERERERTEQRHEAGSQGEGSRDTGARKGGG